MSAIERIGQSIQNIEANYKEFDDTVFNNGGVDEYTFTIHKKLLKEIIGLFKAIVEYPDLLSSEFSINEMNRIAILAESLEKHQYNGSILNEDIDRPLISRVRVVFGEKKAVQYKSEVDKLRELMVRVEDMLKEEERVSFMKEGIKDINAKLDLITNNQLQSQQGLSDIQSKNTKVDGVFNSVNTKYKEIEGKRSEIFELFDKIMLNQKNIQKLEEENTEFSEKLEKDDAKYSEDRDKVLKEAKDMLGDANAGGLAGAFQDKIAEEKNKNKGLWSFGAFIFMIVAIVIALLTNGINIPMLPIEAVLLENIPAKISLTTMPLLVAYFCGAQYLKLERTLEDYQYKKALAQSMPAFMEQLEKGSVEYRAYLSLALQQMLQDPLRKKHDFPSPLKDLVDNAIERILKSKPENKTSNDTTSEKKDDKS